MSSKQPRSRYTPSELNAAIDTVIAGQQGAQVSRATKIPYETLMRKVRERKAGSETQPQRRGPKPLLPDTCEEDLVDWIAAMQQRGYPPDRSAIMIKANQLLLTLDPLKTVGSGWYRRFMQRHPELTNRVAQVISVARNAIDESGVARLYESLGDAIAVHGFTHERIFNMDETSFATRRKSKEVVALKGSRNVWAKSVAAGFHLSVVACGSGSGDLVPPLFLFPGETLEKDLSDHCDAPGAKITTSPKGFMNEDLFVSWLKFFSSAVNENVQRPILLLFDGLSSHYSSTVVELCAELQIVLICLPSNATHLFQPFDVAVFGPFKNAIRKAIYQEMILDVTGDLYTISKPAALRIASVAWTQHVLPKNVVSGFRTAGIIPLSHEQMMNRYRLFKDGGVPSSFVAKAWIEEQSRLRSDVLVVPPTTKKSVGRKRIDVGGRILTVSLLREVDKTKQERHEAAKRKKQAQSERSRKRRKGRTVPATTRTGDRDKSEHSGDSDNNAPVLDDVWAFDQMEVIAL